MIQPGSRVLCILDFRRYHIYWYFINRGFAFNVPEVDKAYTVRHIYARAENEFGEEHAGILLEEIDNTHLNEFVGGGEIGFWMEGFRELLTTKEVDKLLNQVLDSHPNHGAQGRLGEFLYRY